MSNNYSEYESNVDRNKTLSVEEYLHKTRPYLKDTINNLQKFDKLKIQLTIANNFISSIDNNICLRVRNIKKSDNETSEVVLKSIRKLFD